MAEVKDTPTSKQENEPDKRSPWWKRLWARTGVGDKTLWDLLQLLIVPLVLLGIGLLFEMQQAEREQQLAQANERDKENRRIIAALTSRIPEIESPASPKRPPEGAESAEERSWWRRVFGG